MKKVYPTILLSAILFSCQKLQQEVSQVNGTAVFSGSSNLAPVLVPSIIQWQSCLGGSADDVGNGIAKASDGTGYFIAGYTTTSNGSRDAMVVKINLNGILIWQKNIGGSALDEASAVVATIDGGCLVSGYTTSNDGDVIGIGGGDALLFKLSSTGGKEWVKTLGNTGYDRANALIQTTDGAFALAGSSNSKVWLLKFNISSGLPVTDWEKTISLPDAKDDVGYSLIQASNGFYTITGRTLSNATNADIFVLNTDGAGTLQWTKKIASATGGADVGFGVAASTDISGNTNGYVVTGYFSSTNLAVIKLALDGNIIWQKTFSSGSGSGSIRGLSVVSTSQGDIIMGSTDSKNGEIKTVNGGNDMFVLRLNDATGNKISSNVLGGRGSDIGRSVIALTTSGEYIVGGSTTSNNGDVSGNHGMSDFWAVKFKLNN